MRKDESAFLDDHGKEAVNFQISLILYALIGVVIGALFMAVTFGLATFIVAPLAILGGVGLFLLRVIGCACAATAANRGEFFRYPMCVRLIR